MNGLQHRACATDISDLEAAFLKISSPKHLQATIALYKVLKEQQRSSASAVSHEAPRKPPRTDLFPASQETTEEAFLRRTRPENLQKTIDAYKALREQQRSSASAVSHAAPRKPPRTDLFPVSQETATEAFLRRTRPETLDAPPVHEYRGFPARLLQKQVAMESHVTSEPR